MAIFTDRAIRALKPSDKTYELREGTRSGFAIRVHPSGRKTFVHWYSSEGRKRRATLGHYPDTDLRTARERLAEQRRLLDAGIDPIAHQRAQRDAERDAEAARTRRQTIGELIEAYLPHAARWKRPRTAYQEERRLRRHIIPRIGDRPVEDVTLAELVRTVDDIATVSPYSACRVVSNLRGLMQFAQRRGVRADNPARLLSVPLPDREIDRVLGDREITALWRACDDRSALSIQHARCIRLLLLLAARSAEVMGMRWDELDDPAEPALWRLPAARTKQDRVHTRPVPSLARAILIAQQSLSPPDDSGRGPVFIGSPRRHGHPTRPAPDGLARALRQRVFAHEAYFGPGKIEAPFTPHDLRRTARSSFARLGIDPWIAERILGHSLAKLERIYDRHEYIEEMRTALERWEQYVIKLVGDNIEKNSKF